MFLNIAIAIIGGAIISLIPGIPSAVSFIVGVVAATIVFKLFLSTPSIAEEDDDSALPTKTLYVGNCHTKQTNLMYVIYLLSMVMCLRFV